MNKIIKMCCISIILISLVSVNYFFYLKKEHKENDFPNIISTSVSYIDNKLIITYDIDEKELVHNKIYCNYDVNNDKYSTFKNEWVETKDNKCIINIDTKWKYYVYLKNENDTIYKIDSTENYGHVTEIKSNKENVFLAINGEEKISYEVSYVGNIDLTPTLYSDDDKIATIDNDGKIKGISKGNTNINIKVGNIVKQINVLVTDLIVKRPNKFNSKKSYLPCNKYSKKDNNTLDLILKSRIEDVGYKTRAGAVEAARFLTLEFPYKIRYFSENGRGSTNKVEGEGRYYNVGLYLHKSRFKNIKKSLAGPATWGCSLYSRPSKGKRSNGLDCSGFVSWVMLNGGFDVGDIGAGLAPHLDLTDYGVRTNFNANVVKSGKVKVGDLLSSGGKQGGHIAIIVGEDNDYYYVAESLWTPPNVAVVIMPYSKKKIFKRYYYVMLMDSYYKKDGKLTKLWY